VTKNEWKESKEQDWRRKRDSGRDGSVPSRWSNYADHITERREFGALGDVNRARRRGWRKNESRWRSGRKKAPT